MDATGRESDTGQVPECPDITPEQIIVRHGDEGSAWLVDQWGRGHPVGSGAAIGRDLDECDVGVLHPSVSAIHARLREGEDGVWEIADQGSLNGTQVNDRTVRRGALNHGDVLRVGDVSFRFTRDAPATDAPPQVIGQTQRSSVNELPVQVQLRSGDRAITLVRRAEGGVAKTEDEHIRLAPLEYALLRALAERRLAGDLDHAFVSSRELAATLDFRSRLADTDNVRELVRRVRQKLAALDADDIIENERGSGYRLHWSIASDR